VAASSTLGKEASALPAALTTSGGAWQGGNGQEVSPDNPQWIALVWPKPVELRAVVLVEPLMKKLTVEAYDKPEGAETGAWRAVRSFQIARSFRAPTVSLLDLGGPVRTRALRLKVTETLSDEDADIARLTGGQAKQVGLNGVLALTDLGEGPVPQSSRLPVRIEYSVPVAGKVALVVNDAKGQRVANLFAEQDLAAGPQVAEWDGRDEQGRLMPPGEYHFLGAVTPPLKLTYEFTVYNAGDPPWWKADVWHPLKDPGGWISDHSAPTDVQAAGEVTFIASHTAEHGHCLIAVNRDGKKLWGAKWLPNLAGSYKLASEGKTLYTIGEGGWGGNRSQLFAIDADSFAIRQVSVLDYSTGLFGWPGGIVGLAARDGLVYASYNSAYFNQLSNPLAPDQLDAVQSTMLGLNGDQLNGLLRAVEPSQPWVNLRIAEGQQPLLRIAWNSPQRIGTILSPHKLEIAALAPGTSYPGDLSNDADWVPLEADLSSPAMKVYVARPGTQTRALRIRVRNAVKPLALDQPQGPLTDSDETPAEFVGLRAIGPRLCAVAKDGKVEVSSGQVLAGGAWQNVQNSPIDAEHPASYTVRFGQPRGIRGLVIRDPFFAAAEVEFQAAPGGPWVSLGQVLGPFYWKRAWSDISFDFHRERTVSAVRLKVVEAPTEQNYDVKARTGGKANMCSLGGIVFLGSGAGEPAADPDWAQRITVFRAADGKVVRQLPLEASGDLEFTPDGRLLAVSGNQVVSVDTDSGATTPVIVSDVQRPAGLAVGPDGTIFVGDAGDDLVKRFSPEGKLLGTVGVPGGPKAGPYQPEMMDNPAGLCLDAQGRLWVAEQSYQPKKVSTWDLSGDQPRLVQHFLGGPPYGGGFMFIDPRQENPMRFFFQGMEFHADWKTGKNWLQNIHWRPGYAGAWAGVTCDRPIYFQDRLYLTGEPHNFYGRQYMAIARYDKDHAVPVAAAGLAERWPPLHQPQIAKALGNPELGEHSFVWSDLNNDAQVQAEEIQLGPKGLRLKDVWGTPVGYDLCMQFANFCLAPVRITDSGVPVYSWDHSRPTPPPLGSSIWYGNSYHCMALTPDDRIIGISPLITCRPRTGPAPWTYPDNVIGVHGSMSAGPPQPGLLIGTLQVIGQGELPNLGPYFVTVTNKGNCFVFSDDGLLVGRLFSDHRLGRGFNLPKAQRGMDVSDISINCEHFGGTFTQMADGQTFLVIGHNHNSLIRLQGLDQIRRFDGKAELTTEQFLTAEKQVVRQAIEQAKPKVLAVRRGDEIQIDGDLSDWDKAHAKFVELTGAGSHKGFAAMLWSQDKLLLAFDVRAGKDLVNRDHDWQMLFKSGDSVDLQIGMNPSAPAGRPAPAPGDLRLLISRFQGEPVAVVYRYSVPGAAEADRKVFASPVGKVAVDVVEKVPADIRIVRSGEGYVVEAAIPWAQLGAQAPSAGAKLRGDLGILFADEAGIGVAERVYWSNPETGLVADVPGEIRLHPDRWGTFEPE